MGLSKLRRQLYIIIFGTDTRAGRNFDLILLWLISLSVLTVILESVKPLRTDHREFFTLLEWAFTVVFTVEYLLRIWTHPRPLSYIFSFFGLVDLLAILPSYLGIFFARSTFFLTIRAIRLLRMFRILKLGRYLKEASLLIAALKASLYKITVFFGAVLTLVLFLGTLMYMVEGEASGFTSIPQGIYWAIVTITTVGYGDIAPVTITGKLIASLAMLTGYSIIAVPTGILTAEIGKATREQHTGKAVQCVRCGFEENDHTANYCRRCGERLIRNTDQS
ncbi:MAG: ion transporter [Bacteroidota bacterium]